MMVIDVEFNFRDKVYFINDVQQDEFIVTGYAVREGAILYYVSYCGNERCAYPYELSKEKTIF